MGQFSVKHTTPGRAEGEEDEAEAAARPSERRSEREALDYDQSRWSREDSDESQLPTLSRPRVAGRKAPSRRRGAAVQS